MMLSTNLYKRALHFNRHINNICDDMNKNDNSDEKHQDLRQSLSVPIVLVGMMGAGKSHIGSSLAKHLGLKFSDSDKLVEERAGCSVNEIFERFGEDKFRESEKNVVLKLLDEAPQVIATGGGAVTNPETLEAIKAKSISIWLNPDIEILVDRVRGRSTRPLLNGEDPKEKLSKLLGERKALYTQANITVDIDGDNTQQTLGRTIKLLSESLNSDRF